MTPEQELKQFEQACEPPWIFFLCFPICLFSLGIAFMTTVPEFSTADFDDNVAYATEIAWPAGYSPRNILVSGEVYHLFNQEPHRVTYMRGGRCLEIHK